MVIPSSALVRAIDADCAVFDEPKLLPVCSWPEIGTECTAAGEWPFPPSPLRSGVGCVRPERKFLDENVRKTCFAGVGGESDLSGWGDA